MRETITDLQKRDHITLDQLLKRYGSETPSKRRKTFKEIVELVTTHAFAEEEVLFPAARRTLAEGDTLTAQIEGEHQRINELIAEMQHVHPGDAAFERDADELFPLLRLDVRNEEDRLLPALEAKLERPELERLGAAWEAAKKAAPNRPHPNIPRRPPGNIIAGIPLFFIDRVRGLFARAREST